MSDRNQPALHRFDRLDALRGLAIVWMALFHFSFDLNHFGLVAKPVSYTHLTLPTIYSV